MQHNIEGFVWLDWVVEKLIVVHHVWPEEVEEAFFSRPNRIRRTSSGKYLLYSRSNDGRYLFVVFAWEGRQIKVISARDMEPNERRWYGEK